MGAWSGVGVGDCESSKQGRAVPPLKVGATWLAVVGGLIGTFWLLAKCARNLTRRHDPAAVTAAAAAITRPATMRAKIFLPCAPPLPCPMPLRLAPPSAPCSAGRRCRLGRGAEPRPALFGAAPAAARAAKRHAPPAGGRAALCRCVSP